MSKKCYQVGTLPPAVQRVIVSTDGPSIRQDVQQQLQRCLNASASLQEAFGKQLAACTKTWFYQWFNEDQPFLNYGYLLADNAQNKNIFKQLIGHDEDFRC